MVRALVHLCHALPALPSQALMAHYYLSSWEDETTLQNQQVRQVFRYLRGKCSRCSWAQGVSATLLALGRLLAAQRHTCALCELQETAAAATRDAEPGITA
ncbi:hypothetical protein NDU88_011950 [Pleurodeles waltl]|uniref:Uncharacterized protein n=1 Tax=Pleurodeles waltl TaxID=8319 RepID=A0AAV7QYU3_PLEWA|nr:hypothetical protein NDU88_011950 [Pleurodeles waltl]